MKPRHLLAVIVIAYLATGVYQVGPDERAVVRRFGKVVARPGPGLGFALPWGIDRVDRVPGRAVRQVRVGYNPDTTEPGATPQGQLLTGDQNLVNVQLVVDFAVGESDADLDNFVMHRKQVDTAIARTAEAAAAEWAAGHTIDQTLRGGNSLLPAWVADRLAERLPELRLGVRVQRVSAALIAAPDEVKSAFEAVDQAQTAMRTRETQALQERDQRLSQAAALKYRLEQEAAQYRDEQVKQATAEAEAFRNELTAFRRVAKSNPDALRFLWWAETLETLDALKAGGGEVRLIDHFLTNGELNLYAVFDFFGRR